MIFVWPMHRKMNHHGPRHILNSFDSAFSCTILMMCAHPRNCMWLIWLAKSLSKLCFCEDSIISMVHIHLNSAMSCFFLKLIFRCQSIYEAMADEKFESTAKWHQKPSSTTIFLLHCCGSMRVWQSSTNICFALINKDLLAWRMQYILGQDILPVGIDSHSGHICWRFKCSSHSTSKT